WPPWARRPWRHRSATAAAPRRSRTGRTRSPPRRPGSQLTVDPCDERAPVELFDVARRARAALPGAELGLELRVLVAEPQHADLLVEIGVLELLAQMHHHRLGALLGQLAVVQRAA